MPFDIADIALSTLYWVHASTFLLKVLVADSYREITIDRHGESRAAAYNHVVIWQDANTKQLYRGGFG
jgi:hypothetical protein